MTHLTLHWRRGRSGLYRIPSAMKLYENKGFHATGVEDEDEIELVLYLKQKED